MQAVTVKRRKNTSRNIEGEEHTKENEQEVEQHTKNKTDDDEIIPTAVDKVNDQHNLTANSPQQISPTKIWEKGNATHQQTLDTRYKDEDIDEDDISINIHNTAILETYHQRKFIE